MKGHAPNVALGDVRSVNQIKRESADGATGTTKVCGVTWFFSAPNRVFQLFMVLSDSGGGQEEVFHARCLPTAESFI